MAAVPAAVARIAVFRPGVNAWRRSAAMVATAAKTRCTVLTPRAAARPAARETDARPRRSVIATIVGAYAALAHSHALRGRKRREFHPAVARLAHPPRVPESTAAITRSRREPTRWLLCSGSAFPTFTRSSGGGGRPRRRRGPTGPAASRSLLGMMRHFGGKWQRIRTLLWKNCRHGLRVNAGPERRDDLVSLRSVAARHHVDAAHWPLLNRKRFSTASPERVRLHANQ